MTLRRNFGSSRLVRLLSDWAPPDTTAPRLDVAERLGAWLGVSDAISLHAAHQSMKSAPPAKLSDARLPGVLDVEAEFFRVREALVLAIQTPDSSAARARRLRSPTGQPGADAETDVGYAPYRKRYLDLQRHMELRVAALRAHVRRGIGIASPQLAQLAAEGLLISSPSELRLTRDGLLCVDTLLHEFFLQQHRTSQIV